MARQKVARLAGSEPSTESQPARLALVASALVASTLVACSDPPQHAPLIDPCRNTGCPVLGGVGQGSPSSGNGGSSSSGSGGGGGAANSGSVKGTVVDLVDDTFRFSVASTQPAIVEGQGATQAVVSADWDGIDPFELKGVQTALDVSWLSVRPKNGNASIRTLTPLTSSLVGSIQLPLIQTDVIDAVFLGLSTSSTRTPGAAQLVLSFVNTKNNAGVSGVKVNSGKAAIVAYRSGGSWSTDVVQTDTSGLVLIGNLAASAFPGTPVSVTLSGVTSGVVDVAVAADAVTLAELRVTL